MPTAPALGLTEEAEYAERMVPFGEADMLALYTDGIPESFDLQGEQFGQDRLEVLLRTAASVAAPEAVRIVREALQAFVGENPPSDDITLIVLRGTARR
jgi:sigma-B regulation protein RsbU (phosphoserine phosphatase)